MRRRENSRRIPELMPVPLSTFNNHNFTFSFLFSHSSSSPVLFRIWLGWWPPECNDRVLIMLMLTESVNTIRRGGEPKPNSSSGERKSAPRKRQNQQTYIPKKGVFCRLEQSLSSTLMMTTRGWPGHSTTESDYTQRQSPCPTSRNSSEKRKPIPITCLQAAAAAATAAAVGKNPSNKCAGSGLCFSSPVAIVMVHIR